MTDNSVTIEATLPDGPYIVTLTQNPSDPSSASLSVSPPDGGTNTYDLVNVKVDGTVLTCQMAPMLWWTPSITMLLAAGSLTVTVADAPEDNGTRNFPLDKAQHDEVAAFMTKF
jgi:hypothetical protein